MTLDICFMFIVFSVIVYFCLKNWVVRMINEVGRNPDFSQKWYISPKKWMKKQFKIKQKMIPKYLYFELYLINILAILGPVNIIIYIISDFSKTIAGILFMIQMCLVLLEGCHYIIMSIIFKKL